MKRKNVFLESPIDRVKPLEERPARRDSISTSDFYSSQPTSTSSWKLRLNWIQRPLEIEHPKKAAKQQQQLPIPAYFNKQQAAFDALQQNEHCFVEEFCFQAPNQQQQQEENIGGSQPIIGRSTTSSNSSARRFFCATYEDIWKRHCSFENNEENRHLYEVIKEGEPCKLYLDVEYSTLHNERPDNGESVSKAIKELMHSKLLENGVSEEVCDIGNVIELESTPSKDKWSRHFIFPSIVFPDNITMGIFVKSCVSTIMKDDTSVGGYSSNDVMIDPLIVVSQHWTRICCIDLAVYTRNRHFRMFGSCKFGKQAIFKPVQENKTLYSNEHDLFMACLVCNVSKDDITHFSISKAAAAAITTTTNKQTLQISQYQQHSLNEGYQPSPFPVLDQWMNEMINSFGGINGGYIRSSKWFPSSRVIVYNIGNNRYCERIQRQHKSNHIMIVCNLISGVWFQKCLDIDCRDWKGSEKPIPPHIIASTN